MAETSSCKVIGIDMGAALAMMWMPQLTGITGPSFRLTVDPIV